MPLDNTNSLGAPAPQLNVPFIAEYKCEQAFWRLSTLAIYFLILTIRIIIKVDGFSTAVIYDILIMACWAAVLDPMQKLAALTKDAENINTHIRWKIAVSLILLLRYSNAGHHSLILSLLSNLNVILTCVIVIKLYRIIQAIFKITGPGDSIINLTIIPKTAKVVIVLNIIGLLLYLLPPRAQIMMIPPPQLFFVLAIFILLFLIYLYILNIKVMRATARACRRYRTSVTFAATIEHLDEQPSSHD